MYKGHNLVASIDQSTTTTKFSVFKMNGELVDQTILYHKQLVPKEGWLEHNPLEIIKNVTQSADYTIKRLKEKGYTEKNIVGLGITNQRETVVAWDAETGRPFHNAIVWCDNKTVTIAYEFNKKHGDLKEKVGLVASSYFSLFKILWLIYNVPEVKARLDEKKVRFGTIDTWVVYNLTGKYVTDASNASRTFLYNLKGHWDYDIIASVGLYKECLPYVVGSFEKVGTVTGGPLEGLDICSILGDQQSSAYALNLRSGYAKCTYGTGCFMMMSIGKYPRIFKDFITTVMYKHGYHIEYGIEASVYCGAGTINWLKSIGMFSYFDELNQAEESKGVVFYPTFGRIYSPYWINNMTGAFLGLSLYTNRQHMLRAVIESIAYRVSDNTQSEELPKITSFKADGGMTVNPQLMQLQADLLNTRVTVCRLDTCWGVAKGVMRCLQMEHVVGEIDTVVKEYDPRDERRSEVMTSYKRWSACRPRVENWI